MSDPTSPYGLPDERTAGTLSLLLEGSGSATVRALATPAGLDVPVRGTVIHDPGEPLSPSPAALLLLVGAEVADPRSCAVLRRAAEQGFAAVVVKSRGQDPARLVEEARACGIAVLEAGDAVPWRFVDAALSCSLAAYGVGDAAASAPAGGEELFALADTLAAVVGGSVAIEDLDQHVVAYSHIPGQRIDALRERGILQRRVPDMPEQRQQYREVLAAPAVVRFPTVGEELARAAVAVRAGALPLGTLWAIEPEGGLSAEAEAALRDGARAAAPHLLRALNAPEAERRMRRDTLRAVLEGYGPPADEAAARLGLRPGTEFALAAFAPRSGEAAGAALITHIESALVRYCSSQRAEATVAATARAVYVLLPSTAPGAGRRFADGALAAVRPAVGEHVRAAVTRPYSDLLRAAALRREADSVLRATARETASAARRQGEPEPAATAEDVRHRILLDRLGDELEREPWLRLPGIAQLLAYDREQGADYAATVTSWLDSVGDVAGAAARLKVHPNTLRYRLRRIRELFDVDLDDPDVRLAAWLELTLAATRSAEASPGSASR
ncbi:helix-turn-helix domain-containing protein [Streptomyces sp. NPDC004647]|uniref:PucR family transcriptional regulator n=1 Tax=Streptomyces sp. NPDC004647 TaxID=3154671 RepID=UPI0033B24A3A